MAGYMTKGKIRTQTFNLYEVPLNNQSHLAALMNLIVHLLHVKHKPYQNKVGQFNALTYI